MPTVMDIARHIIDNFTVTFNGILFCISYNPVDGLICERGINPDNIMVWEGIIFPTSTEDLLELSGKPYVSTENKYFMQVCERLREKLVRALEIDRRWSNSRMI